MPTIAGININKQAK